MSSPREKASLSLRDGILRVTKVDNEHLTLDQATAGYNDLGKFDYTYDAANRLTERKNSGGKAASVLREYDALVLPTYWEGERYPGIVIEAFAASIPVVTTRWKWIPEIVDDSCGILVEPLNSDALHDALRAMAGDDRLYALCTALRGGAMQEKAV